MAVTGQSTQLRSSGTAPSLNKVILSGSLGEKFGREHHFDIRTPADAIKALCANFDGFEKALIASSENNVGYRVLIGESPIESVDEIKSPIGRACVHVVPVIAGASGGVGKILLGATLIAAAFVAAPFTAGTSLSFVPTVLGGIGISMALGGVSQLLANQQAPSSTTEDKEPSYSFSGPLNLVSQGHPVPICYGTMIVGSVTISAGIDTESFSI